MPEQFRKLLYLPLLLWACSPQSFQGGNGKANNEATVLSSEGDTVAGGVADDGASDESKDATDGGASTGTDGATSSGPVDDPVKDPEQGKKPSDGNEDIGYVNPEIRDNGDFYFEYQDGDEELFLSGLVPAGTYPDDLKVRVGKSAGIEVGDLQASHTPVRVEFEAVSAGTSPNLFSDNYTVSFSAPKQGVRALALDPDSDSVVTIDIDPGRLPDRIEEILLQTHSKFSLWYTTASGGTALNVMDQTALEFNQTTDEIKLFGIRFETEDVFDLYIRIFQGSDDDLTSESCILPPPTNPSTYRYLGDGNVHVDSTVGTFTYLNGREKIVAAMNGPYADFQTIFFRMCYRYQGVIRATPFNPNSAYQHPAIGVRRMR